jgi:uncharacterized protein
VTPRLLPLIVPGPTTGPHGSRSHMTCLYKCGNACAQPIPNTSTNEHVQDVITGAIARRSVLKVGGGALALTAVAGFAPAAARPRGTGRSGGSAAGANLGTAAFTPVPPNTIDDVTVADGYTRDVVISWGDPVTKAAPRFDVRRQSPEAAAEQFGYNNDYVGVLPLSRNRALLVVNHEYTNEELMFPTGLYDSATIKRIAIESHGLSVVEIEPGGKPGSWRQRPVSSTRYNRRITGTTQFLVDGPAAGDARLKTSADPSGKRVLGTFNNCAGGTTPWGTVLSGEENFNQYFQASGTTPAEYATSYKRYGITTSGGRQWMEVDPRFDLTREPHEPFRFGWVVEVDPYDPTSTPRKHTMLGRFKHEGANVTIARSGQAVAYMGDDERGDYLYKFVSADRFDPTETQQAKKHNMTLLTKGTLYVARLTGDGTTDGEYDGSGEWIALTTDTTSFVPGMSVADVLIDTRLAADTMSPTKMDRPEDVEPNPVSGKIYAALTNNTDRGVKYPTDEANPVSVNRHGYVLEITERGGDHAGTAFGWMLLLVCGDPASPQTYFAGFPKDQVSPISCPDNVAFDRHGNLWISTDGNALGSHDGLFRVPLTGTARGQVQQFLSVPSGAETCGPLISDDQLTAFVAVQHPGEKSGATFESPGSTWPHTDPFPRPSVVAAYRA